MLLNNQQIIEEIKKEIKIFIEMNENENTTQNLWIVFKKQVRSLPGGEGEEGAMLWAYPGGSSCLAGIFLGLHS